MESRTSIRKPIPMKVIVNYGMTYSKSWRIRDLSMDGVFVEMGGTELPQGTPVELVFRYSHRGTPHEHRLPASVVRSGSDGHALRFGKYDDHIYTDLVNLLW
jgi:PilZ domain